LPDETPLLPEELNKSLKRAKYQLVGRHAAAKKCRWLHKSLLKEGTCYKHKFYGIKSWRCLQMTPTVAHCTMRCLFCWRIQSNDINVAFDETIMKEWDSPDAIVEGALRAQRRILSGYKAHDKRDEQRYLEALHPKHAAISLAGEPTLYPELGGLVKEFHRRSFTTFIVTNGTVPTALQALSEEPTQLYVSLSAPNEEVFKRVCRPQVKKAWHKITQSLESLSSFTCPTVLRLTLVRNLKTMNAADYAQIIADAAPTYVEAKAYVYVGRSRLRLQYENMPTHKDIREFGRELSELTGYKILDESIPSKVLLLSRLEKPRKIA
jgi:tRNA wybutosine-synthesizing protein 1